MRCREVVIEGNETAGAPATPAYVALPDGVARYGVVVSEKTAAQALPLVGAAGGALVNALFMDHFQDVARGHFIVRRLEKIHGADPVAATVRLSRRRRGRSAGG